MKTYEEVCYNRVIDIEHLIQNAYGYKNSASELAKEQAELIAGFYKIYCNHMEKMFTKKQNTFGQFMNKDEFFKEHFVYLDFKPKKNMIVNLESKDGNLSKAILTFDIPEHNVTAKIRIDVLFDFDEQEKYFISFVKAKYDSYVEKINAVEDSIKDIKKYRDIAESILHFNEVSPNKVEVKNFYQVFLNENV